MMALRNKADFLVLLLISALISSSSARPVYKIDVYIAEEPESAATATAAAEASSLSSFKACPVKSRSLVLKKNRNNLNEAENESLQEPLSYERHEQEIAAAASSSLSDISDTVRFLFAGQSNMVGNSRDANATQFIDLVKVINEDRYKISSYSSTQKQQLKKEELIQTMKHIIMGGKAVTQEAAQYESTTLYDLAGNDKATSLLNNETILNSHPTSTCSFTEPDRTTGHYNFDCERPVTYNACGHTKNKQTSYGPEFMFGHTFPALNTIYKDKLIGITKVAVGGTLIEQWIDPHDEDLNDNNTNDNGCNSITSDYWNSLRDAIHAADGTIEAFVWFQGENDHFNQRYPPCKKVSEDITCSDEQNDIDKTYGTCETDNDGEFDVCCTPRSGNGAVRTTYSNGNLCDVTNPKNNPKQICPQYTPKEKYLKYLTKLVHDVRTEIFNTMRSTNVDKFESKEQIPAVICELGPWIVNGVAKEAIGGSPIVNAQREFVASDKYSVLVNTGSDPAAEKRFTSFYHFDAASMMIIGDRIANALATLLPSSPSARPSDSPSESPSESSGSASSRDPSSSPSGRPSSNFSSVPSFNPSLTLSAGPSSSPSNSPSVNPSSSPTTSADPSNSSSSRPSSIPSFVPSWIPSEAPSNMPSTSPSVNPSSSPTVDPSESPSSRPSTIPSFVPSLKPSDAPSNMRSTSPSVNPSSSPTVDPSESPSGRPSTIPSFVPSLKPSEAPSNMPSTSPSVNPSSSPTVDPSESPSSRPSTIPSFVPSLKPSALPINISSSNSPTESSSCEDNPESFLVIRNKSGNKRRYKKTNCGWMHKDKIARCDYRLKYGGKGRDECPKTCGSCSSAIACQDQSDFFYKKKGNIKDCDWVGKRKKISKIRKKCNKRISYTTTVQHYCPVTCGKVGTGPCLSPFTNPSSDPLIK